MARNVEIRERVGGVFNHADSLLYPKTHINMVEGLLVNGKINETYIPQGLKAGMKFVGVITTQGSTADLLVSVDSYLTQVGFDPMADAGSRYGCYLIANTACTITTSTDHYILSGDEGEGQTSANQVLERGDWLVYSYYDSTYSRHTWHVVNNTYNIVTTSTNGLMLYSDKQKLDSIASNANNYSHPSLTPRSVDTDGVVVLDAFTSDAQGHVTGISTRALPNATTSLPGVMSAADKSKLDGIAAGANNYSLPIASASVLGGVKVGSGLSITSGVLANSSPNATHTGDVTGSSALTIANGVVTNAKLAQMQAMTVKGNNSGSTSDANDIPMTTLRTMLNVEDGANNYVHPTQAAKSQDLTTIETIDSISFDANGHIATLTKQAIRNGSTSVTGLLQLATGAELTTGLNASKATTPVGVKTMIDYFAGMSRYVDLTAANAATVADGSIALVTVS